jgi:hypothetical protein
MSSYLIDDITFFIDDNNILNWSKNNIVYTSKIAKHSFCNHIFYIKKRDDIMEIFLTNKFILANDNENYKEEIICDQDITEWKGDIIIFSVKKNCIYERYCPGLNAYIERPALYLSIAPNKILKIYNYYDLFMMTEHSESFTFVYHIIQNNKYKLHKLNVPLKWIKKRVHNYNTHVFYDNPNHFLKITEKQQHIYADLTIDNINNINNFTDKIETPGLTPSFERTYPRFLNESNINFNNEKIVFEISNSVYMVTCKFNIDWDIFEISI